MAIGIWVLYMRWIFSTVAVRCANAVMRWAHIDSTFKRPKESHILLNSSWSGVHETDRRKYDNTSFLFVNWLVITRNIIYMHVFISINAISVICPYYSYCRKTIVHHIYISFEKCQWKNSTMWEKHNICEHS